MGATLADVARRAGVSLATASRVINDSAHNVTPELRARVLAAVQELRYIPNAHARALVRSTTSTVGVIVHDVSDPYFAEITRGIQRVASDAGRLVMICNTYRDLTRELEYVEMLRSHRVEALVLTGSGLGDEKFIKAMTKHVEEFIADGGQVALIGRHYVSGNAVIPDNAGGAYALGKMLVDMGHRNFGVITGPRLLTTTYVRLDGFRAALQDAGITLPSDHIVDGDFTRDSGAKGANELLERAPDITAIFALNDPMAIGALGALRERGIAVPDQISLAGFDDIPIVRDVTPALTTVRVPMIELGMRAMRMALEPQGSAPRTEQLPTEVVIRASTAPVR
jgi:LacI family transcriptional regulator